MKLKRANQTPHSGRSKPRQLSRSRFISALAALSMICVGTTSALAQDRETRSGVLEEVVVTATRRSENIQEVPVSVTALGGNYLESRGISDFTDLTKAAAGMDLVRTSSASGSTLRIRGVGVRPNSGLDSAVGVLQDDLYQARVGFAFQELLDVEQIAVLRGPQGTLFGKNTISGVIKIATRSPDLNEFSGNLQAVGGNDSNSELRGTVNIPIVDGKLAARISGFDASRDGFTENAYANEKTRNMDRWGGRAKLRWDATDALRIDFQYEKNKLNQDKDSANTIYGPASIQQMIAAGLDPADYPLDLGKAQDDIHGKSWNKLQRYLTHVEYDAGSAILKLLAGYEDYEAFNRNDYNFNPTTTGFVAGLTNYNQSKVTTLETQLVSDLDGPLSYIVGIFFQQNKTEAYTNLLNTTFFGVPGFDVYGPYGVYPISPTLFTDKSIASFGTVNYRFTPKLKASLGARYTDDQKENGGVPGTYEDFKEWTYAGDVQYQFTDDVMVYFAAQKGFTSGGFNRPDVVAVVGEQYETFKPVTTYNYEIGMKSEWFDNRARLNVSIFDQTFDDYQVAQIVVEAADRAITNAAKVTAKGLEADFAFLATDHLTFDGSVAYIKTEYDDFKDAPCSYVIPGDPPQVSPPSCTQQGDAYTQDLSGKNLDNAPEWTGNVGAEYRNSLPFGNLEWFARADAVYRDDTLLDPAQDPRSKQDSFTLYSARLGVESPDQRWKLTFWGNNLSDEDYGTFAESNEFGLVIYQGLTRTYGATLDWSF